MDVNSAWSIGFPAAGGVDTTLQGNGVVRLNGGSIDLAPGASPHKLNNASNTISGYGTIGSTSTNASFLLNNQNGGVIDANNSSNYLLIRSNIANAGLLEATSGAPLSSLVTS
jgi:hypothetical protein